MKSGTVEQPITTQPKENRRHVTDALLKKERFHSRSEALHDYEPNSELELSFRKADIIVVYNRRVDGWGFGRVETSDDPTVLAFPLSYTRLLPQRIIPTAKQHMKAAVLNIQIQLNLDGTCDSNQTSIIKGSQHLPETKDIEDKIEDSYELPPLPPSPCPGSYSQFQGGSPTDGQRINKTRRRTQGALAGAPRVTKMSFVQSVKKRNAIPGPIRPGSQEDECWNWNCRTKFSIFTRKHLCRKCNQNYCRKCCWRRIDLSNIGLSTSELSCVVCFPHLYE
eukprot:TRINITY_DN653_c1_g1_i2.p1 TRINITY_DN653_c1_g1~~TRINITY_DN653_c1_g1_i2.p1  ORF type:complete len:288 (+),score=20.86 TRINITY_DN653_c1_g1_i2:28-864(+)